VTGNTSGSATGSGTAQVSGGTLTGTGLLGAVSVNAGGIIVPGDSPNSGPAALTTGNLTWNGGGHYAWEINNATGTAGAASGWSLLTVQGALNIYSYAGNTFNIDLTSLTLGNTPGSPANFNPASPYAWRILTASGGINGFSSDAFSVNAGSFTSAPPSAFSLVQNGSDELDLVYTPPLVLSTPAILSGGSVQFTIPSAYAGTNYTIWMATNLAPPVTWTVLFSAQAVSSGPLQYIDTGATTNASAGFYRLSVP
jgi:hypothetical protein